ncbi:unnamed protein product [Caenorhabditis sp. 36 PRJEB53466]|nr:unnamed protein product [Caenorhabditis sp. 36 PRJEB53466]
MSTHINPVFFSAIQSNLTSVCYCYRSVHSVSNFYLFTAVLFSINVTISAAFFIFGDRFFESKYIKEFSTESGNHDRGLDTVE